MKQGEKKIQDPLEDFLRMKGWHVMRTHGNQFQSGFPDIFACHSKYGQRWIEVKKTHPATFTPAQLEEFPKICANGSGVWVLIAPTEEEYAKLFKKCNWWQYLRV